MPRISCTRRIEFDAAHRVMRHESQCKHLHGHRYVIEATIEAPELDALGRVVDFGVLKEKLGGWIDANWDHNTILWERDRELGEKIAEVTGQTIFYLPDNPTAENIGKYLLETVCPTLFAAPLICTAIRVQETPNCHADIRP